MQITPDYGISLETEFTIAAANYSCMTEFCPLSFAFYLEHPVTKHLLPLAVDRGSNTLSTRIPRLIKSDEREQNVTVLVIATDAARSSVQVYFYLCTLVKHFQ